MFKLNKKEYHEPVVKVVGLNASQTILGVCVVGGLYFGWSYTGYFSNSCCPSGGTGANTFACPTGVRGRTESMNFTSAGMDQSAKPS